MEALGTQNLVLDVWNALPRSPDGRVVERVRRLLPTSPVKDFPTGKNIPAAQVTHVLPQVLALPREVQ